MQRCYHAPTAGAAPNMPIRVVIADDTDLIRAIIGRLLNGHARIEVVGEARNFAQTLERTKMLRPDILLLDLHMPDETAYPPSLVKSYVEQQVGCVLAISVANDEGAKLLARQLGAKVLLDKAKMATELVTAIFSFYNPRDSTCVH
jgi:chemotaxis response regulator CheB